jgi:hypothetical protein
MKYLKTNNNYAIEGGHYNELGVGNNNKHYNYYRKKATKQKQIQISRTAARGTAITITNSTNDQ